jgi:hypothetical protein
MDDYYYKVKYSFRIGNLSIGEVELIKESLAAIGIVIGDDATHTGKKVVSFDLDEDQDYGVLYELLDVHHFSESDYGLFVALTTDNGMTGIDFPEYVLRFYKKTRGQIAVSIIIMQDNDDGVMHKWADYVITGVEYNSSQTKIEKFELREDTGENLELVPEATREDIISGLRNNKRYVTATLGSSGSWIRGQKIFLVVINNNAYIKTIEDDTEKDIV